MRHISLLLQFVVGLTFKFHRLTGLSLPLSYESPPSPGGVVVVAMNHRILLGVKDKMTVTRGLGKNS